MLKALGASLLVRLLNRYDLCVTNTKQPDKITFALPYAVVYVLVISLELGILIIYEAS